jgi:hypothetical protein
MLAVSHSNCGKAVRDIGKPTSRPCSRTRLFRFLSFGLFKLSWLSWTFGRLPVPVLFRHRPGTRSSKPQPSKHCRWSVHPRVDLEREFDP